MRTAVLVLIAMWIPARAASAAGPVRGIAVAGNDVWAVGDGGLILHSADGGATFGALKSPVLADLAGASVDGGRVSFYGGRAAVGHPDAAAEGVVFRTDDAGKSFHAVTTTAPGRLYGGISSGRSAVLFGQASPSHPSGLLRTVTDGKRLTPIPTASSGYLLAGDFRDIQLGYLVGRRNRIVSLRRLAEPPVRPRGVDLPTSLRAVALFGERDCWAVGDDGLVLRRRPAPRPWARVDVNLPPGTRRLADLRAIAADAKGRIWLAGGLIGVVLHTADGGRTWRHLPAPGPGAVHTLRHLGGETLLAGGDAGRIWRSEDAGRSWRQVHGAKGTDVLVIASAAERTVWPAAVAHAAAGCDVAMLFATAPRHLPLTPPAQPLLAAAAAAGASGAYVLADFPSLAAAPGADRLSEKDVLAAWFGELDVPGDEALLRHLVAAIRLYRPAVVAVGPVEPGATGPKAENRLVARIAARAAKLAGQEDAYPGQAAVGLRPWRPKRLFVAQRSREDWTPPWAKRTARARRKHTTMIDGGRLPRGADTSVQMLACRALWMLPWNGPLDRSPRLTAFRCEAETGRRAMFTTGLTDHRPRWRPAGKARASLAAGAGLRMAIATGRTASALGPAIAAAKKDADSPDYLAADQLLLLWVRLMREGRLIRAHEALGAFSRLGRRHPLADRIASATVALRASREWRTNLRLLGPTAPLTDQALSAAIKSHAARTAWSTDPAGRMLHAALLRHKGEIPAVKRILETLAGEGYPEPWRQFAKLELAGAGPATARELRRHFAAAPPATETPTIDGRMDERFWAGAPAWHLSGRPGAPAGTGKAVRIGAHLLIGLTLQHAERRRWELAVALDADRDAWTQLVLRCDTRGRKSLRLALRNGTEATLSNKGLSIQAFEEFDEMTFEIAIPLVRLGREALAGGTWWFQVRARAVDPGRTDSVFYQLQGDDRLLPERYGLLTVPPAATRPADRRAKARR